MKPIFKTLYEAYLFTAIMAPTCLALYLYIDRFTYTCRPHEPENDCESGKTYQVYVRRIDTSSKWYIKHSGNEILATAETACVTVAIHNYVLHDAKFKARGQVNQFMRIELPRQQTRVCEVI
jgi:hypothetical protein